MNDWVQSLESGKTYTFGFLQVDIQGSSGIEGSPNEVQKLKELFKTSVTRKVIENNGLPLNWAGEGGSFFFPIIEEADATRVCKAAFEVKSYLPVLNTEIAIHSGITKPISVRISCDCFPATFHKDVTIMHGGILNRFLKHERDVGIKNQVIITERLLNFLPSVLRNNFVFYRYLDSLNTRLYGWQISPDTSEPKRKENIERLKAYIRKDSSFKEAGEDTVEIVSLTTELPVFENVGDMVMLAEDREKTEARLREVNPKFDNDMHAILSGEPLWNDSPVVFRYQTTDYIGVETLRGNARSQLPIVSANVVVFCSERRELYLHRRSPKSATYPNYLHTYGGAFVPKARDGDNRHDGNDLIATARRELSEELNVGFIMEQVHNQMLFAKELKTGFCQLVLFVNLSDQEVSRATSNWEGDKVVVGFDALKERLLDEHENWVPTGKAQILAWLALGAPPGNNTLKFNGASAEALFNDVLEHS
jgi:hypothetical protein